MKVCTLCEVEQSVNNFSKHKGYRDGLRSWCKECCTKTNAVHKANPVYKEKQKVYAKKKKQNDPVYRAACTARMKAWRAKNPEHVKAKNIERYGITYKQFQQMLEDQDARCRICATDLFAPQVDHCHTTGVVRGLLCKQCNILLGAAKDSVEILCNAIEYLERSKDAIL